jgi:hypothetical protein
MTAVGIAKLSLEYLEVRRVDQWGNWFRFRARVVDGRGQDTGRWAYDVYLGTSPPPSRTHQMSVASEQR